MKTHAKKKQIGKPSSVRWVAVSGGFDPIHIGHVRMMQKARLLGDKLVVILNNDNWLKAKKGFVFMPQKERAEILLSLPYVDKVYITKHKPKTKDMSVDAALRALRPTVFANGGDRAGEGDIPEVRTCREIGTRMVFNVGGGKVQSSSWMIQGASRPVLRTVKPWGEYYGWDRGKKWNLKTLYIKPGKRLSLQKHTHRSESWVLVEGDATATTEKNGIRKTTPLKKGVLFTIEPRTIHRIESKRGGVFVEIAFGKFDEEDITRLEDDYGRT